MDISNSYIVVIGISALIILSYFFNLISQKTNIPSVLLLIISGVLLKLALHHFGLENTQFLLDVLEVLGIIGLIMIVLEAALDLEISKEKWPLIWKSFSVALLALISSSLFIALIFTQFLTVSFSIALLYAVPLSIMSSAIIIPSVGELIENKREFMVYESTFSDILGIMYFYLLLSNSENGSVHQVIAHVIVTILITIILSVVISYGLVLIFQRVKTQVKLFLLIAVLLLLYSTGKLFHLSSLLIILVFGLVLNNYKLFFRGFLSKWLHVPSVIGVLHNFHLITIESAFVVRTFFFVIFGMSIDLDTLLNLQDFLISLVIVIVLLVVRAVFLRILKGKDLKPELFIAPRGLITILLFFSIPAQFQAGLSMGIVFYTIILTSVVMTMALVASGKHIEPVDAAKFTYWREVDKQIESIPESEHHKLPEDKEQEKD